MTIDEATAILKDLMKGETHYFLPEQREAINLSSEALKAIKEIRKKWYYTSPSCLLGETKE